VMNGAIRIRADAVQLAFFAAFSDDGLGGELAGLVLRPICAPAGRTRRGGTGLLAGGETRRGNWGKVDVLALGDRRGLGDLNEDLTVPINRFRGAWFRTTHIMSA
jgi:hypothetical protein